MKRLFSLEDVKWAFGVLMETLKVRDLRKLPDMVMPEEFNYKVNSKGTDGTDWDLEGLDEHRDKLLECFGGPGDITGHFEEDAEPRKCLVCKKMTRGGFFADNGHHYACKACLKEHFLAQKKPEGK